MNSAPQHRETHELDIVVAAIIVRDGLVLVAQRRSGSLAGKWEFPGGKVEKGETPEQALQREILEEFGTHIIVGDFVKESEFSVDGRPYELRGYYAEYDNDEWQLSDHSAIDWVTPSALLSMDLAPADIPLAETIREKHE